MRNRPIEEQIVEKLEGLVRASHKHTEFPFGEDEGEHQHNDYTHDGQGQHRHEVELLGMLGSTALLLALLGDDLYERVAEKLRFRLHSWERKYETNSKDNAYEWYDSTRRLNSTVKYFDVDRHLWRLTYLFLEELQEYRHIISNHTA